MKKNGFALFLKKFMKSAAVANPNELATPPPFEGDYLLSPNNVVQAIGSPSISFPGATGEVTGPSVSKLQKPQIVYGQSNMGGYSDLGGGWTYSAFDKPPSGTFFNTNQA